MRILKTSVAILAFLFSITASAQNISKKEVETAVHVMAKLIRENYVFPEKGKNAAAHLIETHRKGTYDKAKNWKEFDSLASHTIRSFTSDGHMYVGYDPKTVKELNAAPKDTKPGDFTEDPFFYGPDAAKNNFGFQEVKVLEGNIGYIKLSEINISEKSLPVLYAAMAFVAHTDALIIDVQNNGGGGNAIGNVFESFFLPKETPLLEFKQRGGQTRLAKTVPWLTEEKYNKPLFILTNKNTFSAAEAFAYGLQKTGRAKVVGQPSGGGAHMNSWYPVNEHLYISVSTGAPALPGTEENWEGKGVQPDYLVQEKEIEYIKNLLKKDPEVKK